MPSSPPQTPDEPSGLLKILASVFSGVLFGLFLSKLKAPPQQSVKSITPNSETADKNDSSHNLPPFSPQIPPSPGSSENPYKCCHHKMPLWKVLLEIGTFLAAIGAVMAASIYAGISYKMWCEMQEQTTVQRKTAVNAERAWVGLDIPITLDATEIRSNQLRIKGHYSLKNFGRGPALKVMQSGMFVSTNVSMEIQGREADFFCDSSVKFATGTVPMEAPLKQPAPFGHTLFPGQPDNYPIDFQGPIKTSEFFRFIGCAAYLDQFKKVHWTRFCMERKQGDRSPVPKLDFCAMYNDTDEPKEK